MSVDEDGNVSLIEGPVAEVDSEDGTVCHRLRYNVGGGGEVTILIDLAHQELRSLIGQFRAPIEVGNLSSGMKKILARFRTESGIPVFFQNHCEDIQFPEETEIAIIRVAQESLKNICKHSQAETVRILLRQQSDTQCMMLIEDDGIGFDSLPEREHAGMHIGLSVMEERAKQVGGSLSIESEKDEGTRIMLTFSPT